MYNAAFIIYNILKDLCVVKMRCSVSGFYLAEKLPNADEATKEMSGLDCTENLFHD
jgi:hypothetical protein